MTIAIDPGVYMEPRRKAILCLCYDKSMLQVRRMLLEHFGYTVLSTTTVEDAKNVAENQCPDMLLMDTSHPGIDFEQVAEQVKKVCPDLITVVLSPYYYGTNSRSDGAIDRFVTNDDGPDRLISEIDELLRKRAQGSSASARPM